MKQPETKFKEKVLKLVRTLPDAWFEKIKQVSIRGTPDILGCVKGKLIALELKADRTEDADKLQQYKLEQIDLAGGFARVVYPDNLDAIYRDLIKISQGGSCSTWETALTFD